MTDYFGTPVPPQSPQEWLPPAAPPVMPAWSAGGGDGAGPVAGPWPPDRPVPWLGGLVGALAGLLLSAGFVSLLAAVADDNESTALVAGLLAAGAVAAVVLLLDRLPRGAIWVAGVTVAFTTAVAPMGFWLSTAEDLSIKPMLALFVVTPTAVWAACFVVGGTRGRPVFLVGVLAGIWLLLSVLVVDLGAGDPFGSAPTRRVVMTSAPALSGVAQADDRDGDGIPDEFDSEPDVPLDGQGGFDFESDDGGASSSIDPAVLFPFLFGIGAAVTAVGVISLLVGAGYLAAAWHFDRQGLPGTATPFQGVGIVALVTSIATLSGELGDGGAAMLSLLVAAALLWTGTTSNRRLSGWLGVVLGFAGFTGMISALVDDDAVEAVLVLLAGVGMLAVADRLLPGPPDDGAPAVDLALPGAGPLPTVDPAAPPSWPAAP